MTSTHTVVARFDDPGEAREAMIDLEMKGIDADAIHLVPPHSPLVPNDEVLSKDIEISGEVVRRSATGGLVGALVGAITMIAILSIFRVEPFGTTLLVGVVSGVVGGGLIGGFWGAARRLPVNDEAFDTYVVDPSEPQGVLVEVRLDDARRAADTVAVLRRHHAQHIEREVA